MTTISTTELRTKTKEFIKTLLDGEEIQIVHRSKVLGKVHFIPAQTEDFRKERAKRMQRAIEAFAASIPNETKSMSPESREAVYRSAMIKKHGKPISRR